jgi:hypothetical protein
MCGKRPTTPGGQDRVRTFTRLHTRTREADTDTGLSSLSGAFTCPAPRVFRFRSPLRPVRFHPATHRLSRLGAHRLPPARRCLASLETPGPRAGVRRRYLKPHALQTRVQIRDEASFLRFKPPSFSYHRFNRAPPNNCSSPGHRISFVWYIEPRDDDVIAYTSGTSKGQERSGE